MTRNRLTGSFFAVMLAALILALAVPVWLPSATTSVLFPYLLVVLGFLLGIPASHAIAKPTPSNVQSAVKRALLGLIILDAVLATALSVEAADPLTGLARYERTRRPRASRGLPPIP